MINEDRIILMTKLASYEKHEGKKYIPISKYFRSDYISLQIMKAIICGTIAFGVIMGVGMLYDFEFFIQDIYKMDILQFVKKIGLIYVVTVGVYTLISYILATYRYNRARQSLKTYYANLKKLSKYYE
ncbi:MAG: hypothetical protein ACI39N_04625 [Lachnospiraceae bacterium]